MGDKKTNEGNTQAGSTQVTRCAACGTTVTGTPMDWVRDVEQTAAGQRVRHYCPACARTHLRGIEAGLDPSFW